MRTRPHISPPKPAQRRRAALTAVVCAVAASVLPFGPAPVGARPATAPAAPPPAPAAPATTRTITLLTGDRVEYGDLPDGRAQAIVDPAARPDGVPVTFRTSDVRGPGGEPALYVVPSDAEPYLAAGVLDRELFNVRGLTREGLDDVNAAALPVIVTYRGVVAQAALPAVQRTRMLPSVRGAALKVDRHDTARFWDAIDADGSAAARGPVALERGVAKVWLDRRVRPALDRSVPQIGAPAAWAAGYDGTGITVAVLDTGVDAGHPDLTGKVAAARTFTDDGATTDGNGHGTHVAATIVGTGAASGGRYRGVAPGARLMTGKVLTDEGFGLDSWVISGMEWAAHGGAKVVNLSLGGAPTDGTDPLSQAVNSLATQTGALFVVAAGNSGAPATIGAPGAADAALTVGAVDRRDRVGEFSSRGPRWGDGAAKPEIAAPGVEIVAARATGTSIGTPVGDRHTASSGTSMATPHVAGAAAILAQRHPTWQGRQLKDALISSTADVGGGWTDVGAGRIDVDRAARQEITGPGAINVGHVRRATGPVRRTVEYTNGGTRSVVLNLRLTASTAQGRPAPAGTARLSAGTVSVPAGGRAAVDLIIDPAAAGSGGVFGGTVVADSADGSTRVRSPFSAYVGAQTATLTVRLLDHRGQPAVSGTVTVVDAAFDPANTSDPFASPTYDVFVNRGIGTAQVRDGGVYTALTTLGWYRLDVRRADVVVSPEVRVNGNTEITLDARHGAQHRVSVAEPTDTLMRATEVVRSTAGAVLSILVASRTDADVGFYLTPTQPPTLGQLNVYDKRTLGTAGLRTTASGRGAGGGPISITLHPRYDAYGTPAKLAGDRTVALVDAAEGKPGDLVGLDLRGKLALVGVRSSPEAPNPLNDAMQAATAAISAVAAVGALGVVLYVDAAGASPLPRAAADPVPQLFVSREEGALLRDWSTRGAVSVALNGNITPQAWYNLFYPHDGIPAGHEHNVVATELVRIPTRYHADLPLTYEKNYFVFGARSRTALRESVLFQAPAAGVEFIGPGDPTVIWRRWITQSEQPPNGPPKIATLISNDIYTTTDRARPEERWFEGPTIEGEPTGALVPTCGMCRGGPGGSLLIPAWRLGDSTDHHFVQSWPDYRSNVRVFRGSAEIRPAPPSQGLPFPTFQLGPHPDTYRLLADGPTQWNSRMRAVQRTTTEWTFRSSRPSAPSGICPAELPGGCVHQPLIQFKYRLGLDLANRVPVGRPHTFEVAAGVPAGAPGAGIVVGLWLWSSTDAGLTWRPARVVRLGPGRFQVVVDHPAGGDGNVWLRAEAWDSVGNRVRQTIRNAFRLSAVTTQAR